MQLLIPLIIIHLHDLATVCLLLAYLLPVIWLCLQLKRMQQRLILIWHSNSLACPHVFASLLYSGGQQASEDWQLSQAEVYWPACWWLGLHTITDTKPLFPAGQTPQLRVDTLCSQRLPPCELPTSTHYVWRRQKLIIRTVGRKQPFEVLRIQQLPPSDRPGFVLFHSIQISTDTQPSRCSIQDKRRLLHLSPVTTAMHLPAFVSLQFCSSKTKGRAADVLSRLQRIKDNLSAM